MVHSIKKALHSLKRALHFYQKSLSKFFQRRPAFLLEKPMGWLRLVGSLKWQVSFAKEPYKRDDILQKRPMILRSLLIIATPYLHSVETALYFYQQSPIFQQKASERKLPDQLMITVGVRGPCSLQWFSVVQCGAVWCSVVQCCAA